MAQYDRPSECVSKRVSKSERAQTDEKGERVCRLRRVNTRGRYRERDRERDGSGDRLIWVDGLREGWDSRDAD